jgi:ABC-type dipeptide/oligopeptide/nickel transport system permease component
VILATTVIFAAAFVICNLIAELIYGVVDPRVRIGSSRS